MNSLSEELDEITEQKVFNDSVTIYPSSASE